jgi:hypothetical protein
VRQRSVMLLCVRLLLTREGEGIGVEIVWWTLNTGATWTAICDWTLVGCVRLPHVLANEGVMALLSHGVINRSGGWP